MKPYCESKWPTDYVMQKHCVDEQREAFLNYSADKPADVPSKVFNDIHKKCKEKWLPDYKMMMHCQESQIQAWHDLN